MEGKEKQLERDIEEINKLIDNLKIKKEEINTQIAKAEKLVTDITNRNKKSDRNNKPIVFEYGDIRIGDKVRIKNPNRHQQNKRTVIGVTKTGFARIETNNRDIIRRVANNIVKIR